MTISSIFILICVFAVIAVVLFVAHKKGYDILEISDDWSDDDDRLDDNDGGWFDSGDD